MKNRLHKHYYSVWCLRNIVLFRRKIVSKGMLFLAFWLCSCIDLSLGHDHFINPFVSDMYLDLMMSNVLTMCFNSLSCKDAVLRWLLYTSTLDLLLFFNLTLSTLQKITLRFTTAARYSGLGC